MTTETTNTTNANARKKPVTHKDLAMLALMHGASALSEELKTHSDPVGVLDKVIATFEKNGKDSADLHDLRDIFAEMRTPGVKGRKPVKAGDTRTYKAQQIGDDGDLFIRLPVGLTGAVKGSDLSATFNDDGSILVRVAPPTNAAQ